MRSCLFIRQSIWCTSECTLPEGRSYTDSSTPNNQFTKHKLSLTIPPFKHPQYFITYGIGLWLHITTMAKWISNTHKGILVKCSVINRIDGTVCLSRVKRGHTPSNCQMEGLSTHVLTLIAFKCALVPTLQVAQMNVVHLTEDIDAWAPTTGRPAEPCSCSSKWNLFDGNDLQKW